MDLAVVYSQAALSDLRNIAEFIAREDAESAKVFANRLVDLAESLRRMPERGRPVKDCLDVRVVILSPYLIFYHLDRLSGRVEVLRFWHGARDPRALDL